MRSVQNSTTNRWSHFDQKMFRIPIHVQWIHLGQLIRCSWRSSVRPNTESHSISLSPPLKLEYNIQPTSNDVFIYYELHIKNNMRIHTHIISRRLCSVYYTPIEMNCLCIHGKVLIILLMHKKLLGKISIGAVNRRIESAIDIISEKIIRSHFVQTNYRIASPTPLPSCRIIISNNYCPKNRHVSNQS